MYCPRIKHFIRLNPFGQIEKCGHMNNTKSFNSLEELNSSEWLKDIEIQMKNDIWPEECLRCKETEEVMNNSVRLQSISKHKLLHSINKNYLVVGGVLDNVCNSACQSCNSNLSTKIGSLESKKYFKMNNLDLFNTLPQDRILEIDISGGEPSASKNYKQLLKQCNKNVKIIRINTNGSKIIPEIINLLKNNVSVIVTLSFDGVDNVHDYVRWPIKFLNFKKTLLYYKELSKKYKLMKVNLWTTFSALNIFDFNNIANFAKENNVDHDWAFLHLPNVLNIKYKNKFTLKAREIIKNQNILKHIATDDYNQDKLDLFIAKQDHLRKIRIENYFNFDLK